MYERIGKAHVVPQSGAKAFLEETGPRSSGVE